MKHAPEGWAFSRLDSVAELQRGQSPRGTATKKNKGGVPLVGGAADFDGSTLKTDRFTSSPTKICNIDDIVLCIRATIGRAAVADKAYCLGRGVAGITPLAVLRDFLRYFLDYQSDDLNAAGTGTTFRQIDKKTLSEWTIPVPPIEEQRRIVAKLDRLFTRIKRARTDLNRLPLLIEHEKGGILTAAYRGELTADWRLEHEVIQHEDIVRRTLMEEQSNKRKKEGVREKGKNRSAGFG